MAGSSDVDSAYPTGHGGDPSVSRARRTRDDELARTGWVRRFTASPPRLVELRELYESLGHDVMLDAMLPGELAPECEGCTLALTMFRVIYTRPAARPGLPDARRTGPQPSGPAADGGPPGGRTQ
jgi:hypothetical protein